MGCDAVWPVREAACAGVGWRVGAKPLEGEPGLEEGAGVCHDLVFQGKHRVPPGVEVGPPGAFL